MESQFFAEGCFLCFQMPAGRTGSTQRTSKRGQGLFSSWRQSDLTLRHPSVNSRLGKGATPGTTAPLPCATEYKAVSWHHWNRPPRRLRCPHREELPAAPGCRAQQRVTPRVGSCEGRRGSVSTRPRRGRPCATTAGPLRTPLFPPSSLVAHRGCRSSPNR